MGRLNRLLPQLIVARDAVDHEVDRLGRQRPGDVGQQPPGDQHPAGVADGRVELDPGRGLVVEPGDGQPVAGRPAGGFDEDAAQNRNRGPRGQAARHPRGRIGQDVAFDPELHGGEPLAGWSCSGRRTDVLAGLGRQRSAVGAGHRPGRSITVEPRARVSSRPGAFGGSRPVRRLAALSTACSSSFFMRERDPAVVLGPVHGVDGRSSAQVGGCGVLWTSGSGRAGGRIGARGGRSGRSGRSVPRLNTSCPRIRRPSVHRPRSNCPQSCPQMWVKSWSHVTLRDRSDRSVVVRELTGALAAHVRHTVCHGVVAYGPAWRASRRRAARSATACVIAPNGRHGRARRHSATARADAVRTRAISGAAHVVERGVTHVRCARASGRPRSACHAGSRVSSRASGARRTDGDGAGGHRAGDVERVSGGRAA